MRRTAIEVRPFAKALGAPLGRLPKPLPLDSRCSHGMFLRNPRLHR